MQLPLTAGTLLSERYLLKGALARGEFGFIYMAVDQQSDRPCSLEEFIPTHYNPARLLQIQSYVQTVIADLPQNHPQILRSQLSIVSAQRLFLVQDDIAASTCREILSERLAQGETFSDAEVRQFLAALLPALAYFHDRGRYHGNLGLDSILLQESDQLPILSSFGVIRQLAIEAQFSSSHPALGASWLNTQPYTAPAADLYDVATVALALLTGQELAPEADPNQWMNWRQQVSPAFARLLRQMLRPQGAPRLLSAQQLLLALRSLDHVSTAQLPPMSAAQASLPPELLKPAAKLSITPAALDRNANLPPIAQRDYSLLLLALVFLLLVGLVTWRISQLLPKQVGVTKPTVEIASVSPASEDQMQKGLRDRCQQLGVRYALFTELVDELFYLKHPEWVNRPLAGAEGERMKTEWHQLAATLLTRLESLSSAARQDMGTYNRAAYDRWLAGPPTINRKLIESAADDKFLKLFPEQQNKTLNPRKFGQVWYAIARDYISAQQLKKSSGKKSD